MAGRKRSWLGALERELLHLFGPAQLGSSAEPPPAPTRGRADLEADFEIKGEPGRRYIVRKDPGAGPRA